MRAETDPADGLTTAPGFVVACVMCAAPRFARRIATVELDGQVESVVLHVEGSVDLLIEVLHPPASLVAAEWFRVGAVRRAQ